MLDLVRSVTVKGNRFAAGTHLYRNFASYLVGVDRGPNSCFQCASTAAAAAAGRLELSGTPVPRRLSMNDEDKDMHRWRIQIRFSPSRRRTHSMSQCH